jgi:diaminopropionate ammonia-lyase
LDWPDFPIAHRANPKCRNGAYGPRQRAVLNRGAFEAAYAEIAGWPGYAPTPLVALADVARLAGLSRVDYKDEGGRFGLGSFKALGGASAGTGR